MADVAPFTPALLRPEGAPASQNAAEILLNSAGASISVSFAEKRDDFRTLVKSVGFRWSSYRWTREADGRMDVSVAAAPRLDWLDFGC